MNRLYSTPSGYLLGNQPKAEPRSGGCVLAFVVLLVLLLPALLPGGAL